MATLDFKDWSKQQSDSAGEKTEHSTGGKEEPAERQRSKGYRDPEDFE